MLAKDSPTEVFDKAEELKNNLKPSEIVAALDRHIVGQQDAKKAVAIAMRNRWRRRQLPDELRKEVTPRNVLLVGPTGKITPFDGGAPWWCQLLFVLCFSVSCMSCHANEI